MALLRCRIVVNGVGVKQFVPFALEEEKFSTLIQDGVVAFNVFPNGDKIDMRTKSPFHSISPCPYCGTDNDRRHDPLQHINPKLGIPVEEVEMVARTMADKAGTDDWKKFTVKASNQILSARDII